MNVPGIVALDAIELIPVLELAPFRFAGEARSSPSGSYRDVPEEWHRYWSEALADSGITGLMPVRNGSWHVPTTEFADPARLRRVLEVMLQNGAGTRLTRDTACMPLDGGLALQCQFQDVLIEPGCCADLGNIADWRSAIGYKGAEWQTLWIGHPPLSVLYQAPRLIVSSPHEAEVPTPCWAVCPDQLRLAVVTAEAELERFAAQVAGALRSLGHETDCQLMGRKLAGLGQ